MGRPCKNRIDLSGQTLASVYIISKIENNKKRRSWLALCLCGKEFSITENKLLSSDFCECRSCIAKRTCKKRPDIDLIGHKTKNGSIVISREYTNNKRRWKLKCICGNDFISLERNILSENCLGVCFDCTRKLGNKKQTHLVGLKIGRWNVIEETNKRTTNGNIIYSCLCDCGTKRNVSSNTLTMKQSLSCGCLHKEIVSSMMKKRCGENSPMWKGDKRKKRSEYARRRCGEKAHQLRRYIYKRDNYKCKICDRNKKLNAHHINGWNIFENERYEELNLITLCIDCHNEFHKKYGRGNNTKTQFIEFCNFKEIDLIKINKENEMYKSVNNFTTFYYKNLNYITRDFSINIETVTGVVSNEVQSCLV